MDNDLPVINKALVEYMLNGTPPEKTINECNNMIDFQKICKLTNKYDYVVAGGKKYTNKCYRIYASKRKSDGTIYKVKHQTGGKSQYCKFGNTSDISFIENGDVTEMKVPEYLDKEWYIELAYKRLKQYGVG